MSADGLLIVNKPADKTSRWVTTRISKILEEKKAGHLGTLDPLAVGVLPILLGAATRLAVFLEPGDKVYRATIRLGEATDTQDREGQVIATGDCSRLEPSRITAAAATFVGEILQVPPMYSALKRDGVPLYRLARKGLEVAREPRRVTIFALTVESIALPEVIARVRCSPGTYIRALAHDLGAKLGCGGHLAALTRLSSGPFSLDQAVDLDGLTPELARGRLLPPDQVLPQLPAVNISADQVALIRNGVALPAPPELSNFPPGQLFRLLEAAELIAVARAMAKDQETWLTPVRVFPGGPR